MARIIDTDNFGDDYPNEKFHLFPMPEHTAQKICDIINYQLGPHAQRFYRVVENDYKLQPGFEP